ncbi:Major allergen Pru ar, putative [Ricinus communis]|uniref:Major allergen Pru ar, putative n=1 Tax=Ricinus communis TaxID=3988 RepID=B9RTC4_RICCO|nr:Major allergen Pru ar, putative [Ricinus communis]
MAVVTHESEIATAIPAAKMFKVFVLEADSIIPKILPQVIKSVEILEGNGGLEPLRRLHSQKRIHVKNKVEAIDKDNLTYSYATIEGDPWMDTLEKTFYEVKIVASADGGSICKSTNKYYPKGDAQINEDQIKAGEEKMMGMYLKPVFWQILMPIAKIFCTLTTFSAHQFSCCS